MALKNRNALCEPHKGRIFVCLFDEDGHDVFPHGIVVAPKGFLSKEAVLERINACVWSVKHADPDNWNYEEVLTALQDNGFDVIAPAYWVEE